MACGGCEGMVACGGCERLGVVESGQCERQDIGTFRVLECSPSQLELTNVPAASWCMSLCQCMSLRQAVCPCGNARALWQVYVPAASVCSAARMSLQHVCPCSNVCPCGKLMHCSASVCLHARTLRRKERGVYVCAYKWCIAAQAFACTPDF